MYPVHVSFLYTPRVLEGTKSAVFTGNPKYVCPSSARFVIHHSPLTYLPSFIATYNHQHLTRFYASSPYRFFPLRS